MEVKETKIPGLLIIEPRIFHDGRGYFFETFHKERYEKAGIHHAFVQDNQSLSHKGILRGLHFQRPPMEQGKLVRVIKGAALDVAVDIRKGSPTYGHHVSVLLTGENQVQFWVPPGFAHGFSTLEDNTIFHYKCTGFYDKASEGGICWDDPDLDIDWDTESPILSDKDKDNVLLKDFDSPFPYGKY